MENENEYKRRENCASCNSNQLTTILNLNKVPLAGFFPTREEISTVSSYPLELQICENCKLVQTDSVIDPDILFRDYRYLSSIGLKNHFEGVALELDKKYSISGKNILEFGCNDGVLLDPLSKLGANAIGVDPSINVSQIARDKGLNVITDYFNFNTFGKEEWKGKFDLILSNNTFAHIIDINNTTKAIHHCLKDGGRFIFEVHYLENLVNELQWDNIYHEHIYYYSLTSLDNLLKRNGLVIVDFELISIHSGSIRITAEKMNYDLPDRVSNKILDELSTICDINHLRNFESAVIDHISSFKNEIKSLKERNLKIAGYGASGRANMFCNITGLSSNEVEFIADESPERCGRYIANTDIPIVSPDVLKNSDVDILIIFAWNYSKMIIEKTNYKKFNYLIAFPNIQYLESYDETQIKFKSI